MVRNTDIFKFLQNFEKITLDQTKRDVFLPAARVIIL